MTASENLRRVASTLDVGTDPQEHLRLLQESHLLLARALDALAAVSDCPNLDAPYHARSGCTYCGAMEEMGVFAIQADADRLFGNETEREEG